MFGVSAVSHSGEALGFKVATSLHPSLCVVSVHYSNPSPCQTKRSNSRGQGEGRLSRSAGGNVLVLNRFSGSGMQQPLILFNALHILYPTTVQSFDKMSVTYWLCINLLNMITMTVISQVRLELQIYPSKSVDDHLQYIKWQKCWLMRLLRRSNQVCSATKASLLQLGLFWFGTGFPLKVQESFS